MDGRRRDGEMGEERIREIQISIASSSVFPGFRFSPTDEELIMFYLKKKIEGSDKCVDVIPEVDLCRHEPWDLPASSIIQSENEWFFFSARGRKYPNGSQSRRATESGYWKATGKERNVKSGTSIIGTKRTLVFHSGRAPKGERTEWIMHEYCMGATGTPQDSLVVCRLRKNSDFHLHETPRRRSQDQRNLSDGHTSAFAVSDGIPQDQRNFSDGHASDFAFSDGIPQRSVQDDEDRRNISDGRASDFAFSDGIPQRSRQDDEDRRNLSDGHASDFAFSDGIPRDQRNLSDGHASDFAFSDGILQRSRQDGFALYDGIEQMGIQNGAKGSDYGSKECTSSYSSHSVEQNDSESESYQRLTNESPQHGSSTFEKNYDGEDDCFADIMKDDIVKLDESSLSTTQGLVPIVVKESEVQVNSKPSTTPHALPSQGSADRRIRLRKQRVKIQHVKPLVAVEEGNENRCVDQVQRLLSPQQPPHCVVSLCTDMVDVVVQRRSVSLVLVLMTLLILFVSWLGGYWQVKWLPLVSQL